MSENAQATVTEYTDEHWTRTAIVLPEEGVSFDLVDERGKRLAEINAFVYDDGKHIIVDVIDKDDLYYIKRAFVFTEGGRESLDTAHLVSADFREV